MKQIKGGLEPEARQSNTSLAYIIYAILFLIAIFTTSNGDLELFSMTIFFITNIFFTITLGIDLKTYLMEMTAVGSISELLAPFSIASSLILEFVSSVLLMITMNILKTKFDKEEKQKIELQNTILNEIADTKLLFFIGLVAIGISSYILFGNTFSLPELFKTATGGEKYYTEFIIGLVILIFSLATYVLSVINAPLEKGGDPTRNTVEYENMKTDYNVVYSILTLFIFFIPARLATRNLSSFNLGSLSSDWLLPLLASILIIIAGIFTGKFFIDMLKVGKVRGEISTWMRENKGIIASIIFLCLLGIASLPRDTILMIMPMIALVVTSYLTKKMYDLTTINNKILVK